MAVAFGSVATGGGYPPSGYTISHSLASASGSNRIVLFGASTVGPTPHTVSSCTYNGVSMTLLTQIVSPDLFGRSTSMSVYYLLDSALPASAGTYNASITLANAYTGRAGVLEYTGVAQSAPPYGYATAASSPAFSGDTSASITLASSEGMLVSLLGLESNSTTCTLTPRTGETERADLNLSSSCVFGASDKTYSSSGSNSMLWTPSTTYWAYAHVVAELAAAGGGTVEAHNAALFGATF